VALHRTALAPPGRVAWNRIMSSISSRSYPRRLLRVLLFGCLLLLAGGCAAMSNAKIGISGSNDSNRNLGH
jgi:hypothetical protein